METLLVSPFHCSLEMSFSQSWVYFFFFTSLGKCSSVGLCICRGETRRHHRQCPSRTVCSMKGSRPSPIPRLVCASLNLIGNIWAIRYYYVYLWAYIGCVDSRLLGEKDQGGRREQKNNKQSAISNRENWWVFLDTPELIETVYLCALGFNGWGHETLVRPQMWPLWPPFTRSWLVYVFKSDPIVSYTEFHSIDCLLPPLILSIDDRLGKYKIHAHRFSIAEKKL